MPVPNPDYLITIMQAQRVIATAPMPETFMFDQASNYEAPFAQGILGNGTIGQMARVAGVRMSTQVLTAQIWQGSNDTILGFELDFQAEADPVTEVRKPVLSLLRLTTPSLDETTNMLLAPGPQIDKEFAAQIASDIEQQTKDVLSNSLGLQEGTTIKRGSLNDSSANVPGRNSNTTNQAGVQINQGLGTTDYWKSKTRNQISIRVGNFAYFDSVVIANVQITATSNFDALTGLPMHVRLSLQFKPFFQILARDLDNIFLSRRTS